MPTITPFLWFDDNLESAIEFYTSVFTEGRVTAITRDDATGVAFTAEFELAGQRFIGLNGGPHFHFTEAVSFFVSVESQHELDRYWDDLLADGGEPSQCGWLKDKFGLSWQIVPSVLLRMQADPDREKAARMTQAMMGMGKLDIAALEQAFAG